MNFKKELQVNIFILDTDIEKCAEYHVTKHIGKMQLELSQLLCTALHLNPILRNRLGVDKDIIPYKKTHENHPCAIFTRKNLQTYNYVAGLLCALDREYFVRYNKRHLSFLKMQDASVVTPEMFEQAKLADIESLGAPTCMPEEFKSDSVVDSYRNYYRLGKLHLHDWKNASKPAWLD